MAPITMQQMIAAQMAARNPEAAQQAARDPQQARDPQAAREAPATPMNAQPIAGNIPAAPANMPMPGPAVSAPPPAPPAQAQPAAGGQAPGIATVPGTMPSPLSPPLPQMYKPGDEPVNVQMQQMPGGMLVDQSQAGAAKHALGLDRLPDFNTYLQQTRMHNTVLPGAGDPDKILQQYLGLQKVQAENDLQGTNRMQAADTGAYQRGGVASEQQKNALAAWQADPRNAATASVLTGLGNGTLEGFQVPGLINAQQKAINANGMGPPPGSPQPQSPQGVAGLPVQPGAATPPPAGPPPNMNDLANKKPAQDGGAPEPKTPEDLQDALHEAATGDLPQVKGQAKQSRSQADIVLQFEAKHPGLLQKSPDALNAMAAFLGSQPDMPGQPGSGGQAGLQKLWQTSHSPLEGSFGPPNETQRAQSILEDAATKHTGMQPSYGLSMFGVHVPFYSRAARPVGVPAAQSQVGVPKK